MPHQQEPTHTDFPNYGDILTKIGAMASLIEPPMAAVPDLALTAQAAIAILFQSTVPARAQSMRIGSHIKQYPAGIVVLRRFVSTAERLRKGDGFHAHYFRQWLLQRQYGYDCQRRMFCLQLQIFQYLSCCSSLPIRPSKQLLPDIVMS